MPIDDEKISELLLEYDAHRLAIKSMIEDIEKIRTKVDKLIPNNLDARYIRFFEEKVKSVTNLFNSLLEMRKEIAKSVKDEIEIRRKFEKANTMLEDIEEILDVRKMADRVDKFKKKTSQQKQNRIMELEEQIIEDIEIPGLTTQVGGKVNE